MTSLLARGPNLWAMIRGLGEMLTKSLQKRMPFLIFVLSIVSKAAWNKMSEIFFLIQPNIRIRGHA